MLPQHTLAACFTLLLTVLPSEIAALASHTIQNSDSSAIPTPLPFHLPEGPLHVPLYRRHASYLRKRSPTDLSQWAIREKSRINSKYAFEAEVGNRTQPLAKRQQDSGLALADASSRSGSSARASSTAARNPNLGRVNLTNYLSDLEYLAPIRIGIPAQTFNVILDTGSADLWLGSSACDDITCGVGPKFNTTSSATSVNQNRDFSIRYGTGYANGALYSDLVTLGGQSTLQNVGVCDDVSNNMLSGNASGLMGLGFQSLSTSQSIPFWQNVMNENLTGMSFPGFSFALSRFVNISDAEDVEPGGIFTLGSLSNSSFQGNLTFTEVPQGSESYWVIPMDGILFNGTWVQGINGSNTAIDTGTTLIGGPADVVASLYSLIPGSAQTSGEFAGYWTYPCDQNFTLALSFGGIPYNMTEADFNLGTFTPATATTEAQCLGVFFDLSLSAGSRAVISWVVGAAFLKNVYSVYRYAPTYAVGFAPLRDNLFASYYPQPWEDVNTTLPFVHSGAAFGPPGAPSASATSTEVSLAEAGFSATATPVSSSPASLQFSELLIALVTVVVCLSS